MSQVQRRKRALVLAFWYEYLNPGNVNYATRHDQFVSSRECPKHYGKGGHSDGVSFTFFRPTSSCSHTTENITNTPKFSRLRLESGFRFREGECSG
jgi:hypothetical protein